MAGFIRPVILSGGSGTRLWPLSRTLFPKQFLPLGSDVSLLTDTARRSGDPDLFSAPMVLCNATHRFMVAEHLRQDGFTPHRIVLEPIARNTAPAVTVAALVALKDDAEAVVLVMPSDHVIKDVAAFHAAVRTGLSAVQGGALVTFGITPGGPETGYGYIKRGKALEGIESAYAVDRFVEKPDRETAETYVADASYSWNSGMFLFRAKDFIDEVERYGPDILSACRKSLESAEADLDFLRLDEAAFALAPSMPIDIAVMEKTDKAAVIPVSMGWSDVGSWASLWELGDKDRHDNVLDGDILCEDVSGCYIRSDGALVTALGVSDLIVVSTDDSILVMHKDHAQDLRKIVDRLKAQKRPELESSKIVYRPWGSYQEVDCGERFKVKRLVVSPGSKLSRQLHHHRAEHWVVVRGTAKVLRGTDEVLLQENESIFIPLGTVHRLENPGKLPLHVIEVQSGGYLEEDDIQRFDDDYGRA